MQYLIPIELHKKNRKLAERHGRKARGRKNFLTLYDPELKHYFSHWKVVKVTWQGFIVERNCVPPAWRDQIKEM